MKVVGTARFELATLCAQGRCSTQAELSPEQKLEHSVGFELTWSNQLAGFAVQRLRLLGHECYRQTDGAESRNRTDDVLLTMQLLCQLSCLGIENELARPEGFEPSSDRLEDGCLIR